MNRTLRMVMAGLLIALEIVLSRFLSITTPITKIGFGFFPIVLIALQFGPLWAGASGALADFLGANLFPLGPYFPGFTVTGFLTGLIFGLFLYNKPHKLWRAAAAAAVIGVFLTVGLNCLWLSMLYGKGYLAFLPGRMTQAAVMIPTQVLIISTAGYRLDNLFRRL